MTTFSYFTELSAETRVLIYGFVFGTCSHVKRIAQDELPAHAKKDERLVLFEEPMMVDPVLVATSVLATNKLISGEAMETFYNTKNVRLTFTQVHDDVKLHTDYLDLVRNIEIIECFNHFLFQPRQVLRDALTQALQLPKIRSVTILTEYLAYNPNHPGYGDLNDHDLHSLSVSQFAKAAQLGTVRCTDIGRYEINGGVFSRVCFANSKLLRMWPDVKATPKGYDGYNASEEIQNLWGLSGYTANLVAFASQASFRVWVGLYEQWLCCTGKHAPGQLTDIEWIERTSVDRYLKQRHPDATIVPRGSDGETVPLHMLGPQHDTDTLAWATEFLALNIETFGYMKNGMPPEMADAKAYWPELESGEGIDDAQARYYKKGQKHFERSAMVKVPCREHRHWEVGMIKDRLLGETYDIGRVVFGEDYINSAGEDDSRQMFYLMIAMNIWVLPGEDQSTDIAMWSASLLKKYLLGAGVLEGQGMEVADLSKLRLVFKMAIALVMLQHSEGSAQESTAVTP
ncbi:hypothetical protein LTR36_003946 [Oleoguttula mirabilis]|uniref:Uncharacterized protein n=1 Tax=Oleoguttula mirabilis TaxID=1507867 RepID=A0AAV9JH37_9PEZI|nr:hypothetical protein LTR36_003946 [Oleoguttula mirabilis]